MRHAARPVCLMLDRVWCGCAGLHFVSDVLVEDYAGVYATDWLSFMVKLFL